MTLAHASYPYSGKARKPAVKSVELDGERLSASTDYTVSYSSNRNVGTGKATVTGRGRFTGCKTVTFEILPKGASIKKLVAGKRSFTAIWKKQAVQTTGYQLQCSTGKGFRAKRTFTLPKTGATSRKVTKLEPGKRYYVRLRTYRKVGGIAYCSPWSTVGTVVTRR